MRKLVWVLIDGVGDVSIPSLNNLTPLQYHSNNLTNINLLAEYGLNGLMDPVEPGLACGSDTAHMSLFGYDPKKHYRGRGAYESMGAGLPMKAGDIAFKSNFGYIDEETQIVISRRADRNFVDYGPPFCNLIDSLPLPSFPGYEVSAKYATEHRCGVRVRGPKLTDCITGTDPLKDGKKLLTCEPTDDSPEAILTSKIVNELSNEIQKKLSKCELNGEREKKGLLPANCVLLRGCGSCIDVPSFSELHGLKSFMIAPTCIIKGLGLTLNFDIIEVEGATGDYHTNLGAKFRAAFQHITNQEQSYALGFIHIKAIDDAGHDKNVKLKLDFLQQIDTQIGWLIKNLKEVESKSNDEYSICVTGDHSTPVEYGDHSFEPVPFLITAISSIQFQSVEPSSKRPRLDEKSNGSSNPKDDNLENLRLNQTKRKPQVRISPKGYPIDDVTCFNEIQGVKGALGRFLGGDAMNINKNHLKLQ